MKSARHSSLNNAMMYKRDATYLLKISQLNGLKPETVIPEWKPIYCEDAQLARSINTQNVHYTRNSYVLATEIIETRCGITLQHPNRSVSTVITKLMQLKRKERLRTSCNDFYSKILMKAWLTTSSRGLSCMHWSSFVYSMQMR